MSWDHITLFIIAGSGTAAILLTQLRDVLIKLSEVIDAWRDVSRRIKAKASTDGSVEPRGKTK